MIIRPAVPTDAAAVCTLAQHFLDATPYGRLFPPRPGVLEDLLAMCLELGTVLVAEEDDALVGFIAVVAVPHPISGVRYADELAWWVEPTSRKSGVGVELLTAAENYARQTGLAFLKMVAPTASAGVATTYERLGYVAVETAFIKPLP